MVALADILSVEWVELVDVPNGERRARLLRPGRPVAEGGSGSADRLPVPVQRHAEREDDPADPDLPADRPEVAVEAGDDRSDGHHQRDERDERQHGVPCLHG